MTKSTTRRTVPYRRKREGKTNYKKRLELLKGRTHRLVIRRTNKHLIMQIVDYHPDGDRVIIGVSSKKLEGMGWKHSAKNLPACYLTGLLLARAAKEHEVAHAVLDLGLQTPIKGSRLYAALKGAIDGGLDVPASDEVFPPEDRLIGKHVQGAPIAEAFSKLKEAITKGA
ncbi:50S ribosomal protein L18 [Candidatus Woesearchaeota archaeon]|nr:50S ribosomal protein L18 [Candidatus Woesearchaeota archaeon]